MVTKETALVARVLADLPHVGAAIVARIAAEVPAFRSLPDDVLQVEIRSAVDETFVLVLRSLVDGAELDTGRLSRPLRQVMVRVEDRPSFEDILRAYFIGVRVGWERLVAHADPDEMTLILLLVGPLTEQLQTLFVAAAHAYLDEQVLVHGEVGEARRELAAALLAGEQTRALAKRAGVRVDTSYTLLTWHLETRTETALLRRRIRGALNDMFGTTVLNILDESGGIALVPGERVEVVDRVELADPVRPVGPVGPIGPVGRETLESFTAELATIVGGPTAGGGSVTAAAGFADTAHEVPAAAREASEVLDVVLRLGRPPGLYLLDDVLLEVQLARPGAANDRLANRLAPLEDRPGLLATLQTFIAAGHNRRRASSKLHVHPNTLDYRLHRVAEFTGLEPTDPADMHVLSAALTVRALRTARDLRTTRDLRDRRARG